MEINQLSFREIIRKELPRLHNWSSEQKIIFWDNVASYFLSNDIELPAEMRAIIDTNFKINLAYDETFCEDVGISYHNFDIYWDDIRAALALRFYEQYISKTN